MFNQLPDEINKIGTKCKIFESFLNIYLIEKALYSLKKYCYGRSAFWKLNKLNTLLRLKWIKLDVMI